jgi:hypothetical protein
MALNKHVDRLNLLDVPEGSMGCLRGRMSDSLTVET